MDPAEVRRRNFIAKDAFPHTTVTHAAYDSGDYEGALDLALRSAGYDELREEQRRRREQGDTRQLGIGISTYVEITNGIAESEFGEVEITPDGGAILRTGLVLARPGPRDDVRDDRRRAARAAGREGDRPQGRHGRDRHGHRDVRVEVDADRRGGREARRRRRRRAGEAARRRLPRGEPGRHRARPGPRPPARRRRPRDRDLVGRPRLARVGRRAARRAEGGARVPGAADASPSARTSRWSRSTPRRRRSSCCGSSRSTTPAR